MLAERKQAHFAKLLADMMEGRETFDQGRLERTVAWFKGAEWLLDQPDLATDQLSRELGRVAKNNGGGLPV